MERNLLEEIVQIINSGKSDSEIRELLSDYHDNDIALVVHDLTKEERFKLYHVLTDEAISEIFSYLDDVEDYIEELSISKAADIIELMDSDDAVDVLDELDENHRQAIIEEMDDESVEDIKLIDKYEDDEIGSKMTTNYIAIRSTATIKQAMREVIKQASTNDNVSIIFVINDDETYYGSIDLRDLIIAREDTQLDSIIKTSYPYLSARTKISDCINELKDYSLEIIPVLDDNKKLIGVITSDDIVETLDEELSDDYAKLAGLSEDSELDEKTMVSFKKRIPWLLILLGLDLIISLLISQFEGVVKAIPMLVFFQSLILGIGGNCGTQSLGVTIRLLSDGDLTFKKAIRNILKEGAIGLINGIILGTVSFGLVLLFLYISKTEIIIGDGYIFSESLKAAFVISLSLVCAMMLSSIVGCLMPMFFEMIHIDPAVASGPFITTLNDVISVLVYYGLAILIFSLVF